MMAPMMKPRIAYLAMLVAVGFEEVEQFLDRRLVIHFLNDGDGFISGDRTIFQGDRFHKN